MIKRDVVNRSTINEQQYNSEEIGSVDDIFAAADLQMAAQAQTATVQFKEKKKKHPIRNAIITFLILTVVGIVVLVFSATKYITNTYPQVKQQILEQYSRMREELSAINNDELSTEQYYQKQFLMLFTDEELETMIIDIDSIGSLLKAVTTNGAANVDLMPKDKVDQYNKLYAEYLNAKNKENSESTTENNPTSNTISIDITESN